MTSIWWFGNKRCPPTNQQPSSHYRTFRRFCEELLETYSLGENVTIDEKLEAFWSCCWFKQYIPSKPAKYSIKIFSLCNSKTVYTHNLEIYFGNIQRDHEKLVISLKMSTEWTDLWKWQKHYCRQLVLCSLIFSSQKTILCRCLDKKRKKRNPHWAEEHQT